MTPEYISLKEGFTVADALEIRRLAAMHTSITDAARRLTGTLSLRELVTAQPEQTIGEIMTREAAFVHTDTDQEEVAGQSSATSAMPVVDRAASGWYRHGG